jgi:hypothetical protein
LLWGRKGPQETPVDLFWLPLFVAVLVPVCIAARRAYTRDIKAMAPEEREEERYQQQVW